MSATAKILDRLHRVKQTAADKWAAGCPLCQSRNGRPLAVRSMPDGRTLLYAFCGCGTGAVLGAIGLSLTDLFPESLGEFKPERRPFDALQVLQAVAHEVTVAILLAEDIAESGSSDAEQRERLSVAGQRLTKALALIGETPVPKEIQRIRRAVAA